MPTFGVALTVPAPWGAQLQAARARFGDPMADAIPPHVTLLPPTAISLADLPAFEAHLTDVAGSAEAFEIVLSGTGTFRPVSPVVFVQVSRGISGCERLERAVRSGPVARPLEFNYHPHVTVAHHLDDDRLDAAYAALADFRCSFVADAIHLYRHGDDEVWRPVAGYPLRASVDNPVGG